MEQEIWNLDLWKLNKVDMKKIAITGHTRGIGKALVERLDKRDYEIKGFSQSTGYNLQRVSTVKKVVNECLEWDVHVLVNNAYVPRQSSKTAIYNV